MSHSKNRLRELRNSRNMSGVDVAEAINITPQYYYELEKGEKRLNEDLLRKLKENPLSGGSLQAPTALLKSVKMQKFSPSSLVTMFSSNVK